MKPPYQAPLLISFSGQGIAIAEGICDTGGNGNNENCEAGCTAIGCNIGGYTGFPVTACCTGGGPGLGYEPPMPIDCGTGEAAEYGSCLTGPVALTTCTTGDCPLYGCLSGSSPCTS